MPVFSAVALHITRRVQTTLVILVILAGAIILARIALTSAIDLPRSARIWGKKLLLIPPSIDLAVDASTSISMASSRDLLAQTGHPSDAFQGFCTVATTPAGRRIYLPRVYLVLRLRNDGDSTG